MTVVSSGSDDANCWCCGYCPSTCVNLMMLAGGVAADGSFYSEAGKQNLYVVVDHR